MNERLISPIILIEWLNEKGESLIYDSIHQSLKMRMRSVKQTSGEEDDPRAASVRSLEHVMDRPLPVYIEKKDN